MTRATVFVCALLAAGQSGQAPAPSLDATFIASTIDALGAVITREYIDPDVAERADARLRQALADRRYATATTADALARMVNGDMYQITHDKHLVVEINRPGGPGPTASDDARAEAVRRCRIATSGGRCTC
jgi:hypothetical protein